MDWEVPHFEQSLKLWLNFNVISMMRFRRSFSDVIPERSLWVLVHFTRMAFDFECSGSTYSKDETFFGSPFEQPGKFFDMQKVTQLASAFAPPLFWVRTYRLLGGQQRRRWRWKIWKRIGPYDIYGNIHDIVLVHDSIYVCVCIYIYISICIHEYVFQNILWEPILISDSVIGVLKLFSWCLSSTFHPML